MSVTRSDGGKVESEEMITVRVVSAGALASGKTTLFDRLKGNAFTAEYEETVGISYSSMSLVMEAESVQLELWDKSAADRFDSLTEMYYLSKHLIIAVLDAANPNGVKQLRAILHKDLRLLNDYFLPVPEIVLAVTKMDEITNEEARLKLMESVQLIKAEFNIKHHELISAKTSTNIHNFLMNAVHLAYQAATAANTKYQAHKHLIENIDTEVLRIRAGVQPESTRAKHELILLEMARQCLLDERLVAGLRNCVMENQEWYKAVSARVFRSPSHAWSLVKEVFKAKGEAIVQDKKNESRLG